MITSRKREANPAAPFIKLLKSPDVHDIMKLRRVSMKKIISIIVLLAIVLSFSGCNSNASRDALISGDYDAVGDYPEYMTPNLRLDLEENTFHLCMGAVVSYAERGSFVILGNQLMCKSQNAFFIFEITDNNTLVLTHNTHFDELPPDAHFILAEDI